MSKQLEIELTRGCILVITDTELMSALPTDMLARGLKRGKAIQRRRIQGKRVQKIAEGS